MKYLITYLLIIFSPFVCSSGPSDGSWEGQYILHGSGWPIRMHIKTVDDQINVALDIPNLVYAAVPTEAKSLDQSIQVTMPFGLETLSFTVQDDILVADDHQISTDFKRVSSPPYSTEPFSWNSGGETLHGTLYLPSNRTDAPLLIRLHGSATGSRAHWEYASWGDYFARKGLAVLVFDRRGEGASVSAMNNIGFKTLANDVIALIEAIGTRDDIDTDRIILNGGSQAAYIAFLVQSMSDEVDYLLLSGAPSVELIEQERKSLQFSMQAKQEPTAHIHAALAYQDLYFHYVRTGENWPALEAAIASNHNQPWIQYTDQPRSEADMIWWRNNHDSFLPHELIPNITTPMLLLYGENDVVTPPSVMISNFDYLLGKHNKTPVEMVVCPNVGHGLEEAFRKDQWGQIIFPQKSACLFTAIDSWLQKWLLLNEG